MEPGILTRPDIGQLDMGALSSTGNYPDLDLRKLMDAGVLRITYPGNGKDGGFVDDKSPNHYSLVTLANDMAPASYTKAWPNKPESFSSAQAEGFPAMMYDGKYHQVLWSLNQLGLPIEQFLRGK